MLKMCSKSPADGWWHNITAADFIPRNIKSVQYCSVTIQVITSVPTANLQSAENFLSGYVLQHSCTIMDCAIRTYKPNFIAMAHKGYLPLQCYSMPVYVNVMRMYSTYNTVCVMRILCGLPKFPLGWITYRYFTLLLHNRAWEMSGTYMK